MSRAHIKKCGLFLFYSREREREKPETNPLYTKLAIAIDFAYQISKNTHILLFHHCTLRHVLFVCDQNNNVREMA